MSPKWYEAAGPPLRSVWRLRTRLVVGGLTALALMAGTVVAETVLTGATSVAPGTLSVVAGTGVQGAPTAGPATQSDLDFPIGVATDASGDLYVVDEGSSEVDEITPSGSLSVIAGTGTAGPPTPGPATSSDLDYPTGVAVDASGDVFIADKLNDEVEEVTAAGMLSVIAGTGTAGPSTPGPATSSDLDYPAGVAVDASGDVFIADQYNDEVEEVTAAGMLSVIAGTGTAGPSTPGPATSSDLDYPAGVAVDASGDVYIADNGDSQIDEVAPDGILSVVAGTGTDGTPTPGPAADSELDEPNGVAVDASGDIYIADTGNAEVEEVAPDGTLSVVAGTGTAGPSTSGPAVSSDLDLPFGVAVDSSGDIYFSDAANFEVDVISGGVQTTPPPPPPPPPPAAALVAISSQDRGYLTATASGQISTVAALWRGSPHHSGMHLGSAVVGLAATSTGYVVATAGGNVYNYHTAFRGSPRSTRTVLSSSVVGIAASGDGYLEATAGGGIYAFGTTVPAGCDQPETAAIVALAGTPRHGYLMATATGNVYPCNTAFHGSPHAARIALTSPVVGIASTATGYIEVTAAGNVYPFGTAFHGSPHAAGVTPASPVTGITATPDGDYRLVTRAGVVYTYT